jgi:hypothetical protein
MVGAGGRGEDLGQEQRESMKKLAIWRQNGTRNYDYGPPGRLM